MKWVCVGGDKRYAYVVRHAQNAGFDARGLGFEHARLENVPCAKLSDVGQAEVVVLPNPFLSGVQLPLAREQLSLETLIGQIKPGARLMMFGSRKVPQEMDERFRITHLSEDEQLMLALARQTAQGALHAVSGKMDCEWYACEVLLIGYGRIGQALHRMLNGYDANVIVAARRASVREQAKALGACVIDMEAIPEMMEKARVVFSTPAQRVLNAGVITHMKKTAMLADLSSSPFGADVASALAMGIEAWREPALPGRFCSESAGRSVFDAVVRALNNGDE